MSSISADTGGGGGGSLDDTFSVTSVSVSVCFGIIVFVAELRTSAVLAVGQVQNQTDMMPRLIAGNV